MNVINQEECDVYDQAGRKHKSTLQVIDTGIKRNGQSVVDWGYVSGSGVISARRGGESPPYQKPPKCPPEFWRREKRPKQEPNWEVVNLKNDAKELGIQIQQLSSLIQQKTDELGDACVMVKGLIANQKLYLATMQQPCSKTAAKLKEWNATKKRLQKEYECLQHSYAGLIRLKNKLHLECLAIRHKERT